jgi:hypothetical protein
LLFFISLCQQLLTILLINNHATMSGYDVGVSGT